MRLRGSIDSNPMAGENEVYIMDGEEYHPLTFIQRQGGGGVALKARWGGSRRWPRSRPRAFSICHSPNTPGDCLYSAFRRVLEHSGCGPASSKRLRKMVQHRLQQAYENEELLHGATLSHWAAQLQMSERELVTRSTGKNQRWGNTLDLSLLAQMYSINLCAIDMITGEELLRHECHDGNMWCIGLKHNHFMVLKRKHYRQHGAQSHNRVSCRHGGSQGHQSLVSSMSARAERITHCPDSYSLSASCTLGYALSFPCSCRYSLPPSCSFGYSLSLSCLVRSWLSMCSLVISCVRGYSLSPSCMHGYSLSSPSCSCGYSVSTCYSGYPLLLSCFLIHGWSTMCSGLEIYSLWSLATRSSSTGLRIVNGGAKSHKVKNMRPAGSVSKAKASSRHVPKCGAVGAQVVPCEVPVGGSAQASSQSAPASIVAADYKHMAKARTASRTATKPTVVPKKPAAKRAHGTVATQRASTASGSGNTEKDNTTTSAQPSQPTTSLAPTVRPYPLSPLFKDVVAFPPPHMGEAIEVTAAYAFNFPDRKFFEDSILVDQDAERFSFLRPEHIYHDYYLAVLKWVELRQEREKAVASGATATPPVRSTAASSGPLPTDGIMESSRKDVGDGPKLTFPPVVGSRKRSALQEAVAAVSKRRKNLGIVETVEASYYSYSEDESCQVVGVTAERVVADDRPPLPRRQRPTRDGRAPLPRHRAGLLPREKPMPKPKVVLSEAQPDPWQPFSQPWFADARSIGGTMKIEAKFVPSLNHFAKQIMTPIAALLGIRILSVGRRCGETMIRIMYEGAKQNMLPLVAASVADSTDLSLALGQVKQHFHFVYLESFVDAVNIAQIFQSWTQSGRAAQTALMMVLRGAFMHVQATSRLCRPASVMLFPQACNVAVLVAPLTCHGEREILRELQCLTQEYLARNPVRAENLEWCLKVNFSIRHGAGRAAVSASTLVIVEGGAGERCIITGCKITLANPESLRRRLAHHREFNDVDPRPRPTPIDYVIDETTEVQQAARGELQTLRDFLVREFDGLDGWTQYTHTPDRRRDFDDLVVDNLDAREVNKDATRSDLDDEDEVPAWAVQAVPQELAPDSVPQVIQVGNAPSAPDEPDSEDVTCTWTTPTTTFDSRAREGGTWSRGSTGKYSLSPLCRSWYSSCALTLHHESLLQVQAYALSSTEKAHAYSLSPLMCTEQRSTWLFHLLSVMSCMKDGGLHEWCLAPTSPCVSADKSALSFVRCGGAKCWSLSDSLTCQNHPVAHHKFAPPLVGRRSSPPTSPSLSCSECPQAPLPLTSRHRGLLASDDTSSSSRPQNVRKRARNQSPVRSAPPSHIHAFSAAAKSLHLPWEPQQLVEDIE
eukprot:2855952-Amphidinium_carterae.1